MAMNPYLASLAYAFAEAEFTEILEDTRRPHGDADYYRAMYGELEAFVDYSEACGYESGRSFPIY